MKQDIILTGDRPSGRLHIGHYAGSLAKRLELQHEYEKSYIMIADLQALTDHAEEGGLVSESVMNIVKDYLACGIDPELNTIYIQSLVPELSELTMLYMNFVTLARLKRNPTVKSEMAQKNFGDTVPVGFLNYPVSQAADITAFKATLIPVGEDQLPMIEQTNEIVRHINYVYNCDVLVECKALLSRVKRLSGTDGSAKMSKSLGNCIYLSDDAETIKTKVMGMYTDPRHIRVEDPGHLEGNTVFEYLEAFDPDRELLEETKEHYQRGGLGDVKVKRHLVEVMLNLLNPIRERREALASKEDEIMEMLIEMSARASAEAHETLMELKEAMGIAYMKS